MESLTSRKNQYIQHLRKLVSDSGYRAEQGEYVLDGEKLLLEALEDKSERGRTVKLDYMNEDDLKFQYYRSYQTHVNGILHYVEEAMTYAGQGGDISGSLEFVEMNYSELISDYNDCIVG